jgi:predicted nucleotidyltransferase
LVKIGYNLYEKQGGAESMSSIERIKKQLAHVFQEYGLNKAAVFGSYASGEEREDSDVDLLISSKRVFDLDPMASLKKPWKRQPVKKLTLFLIIISILI